jgi:hypothetical protein
MCVCLLKGFFLRGSLYYEAKGQKLKSKSLVKVPWLEKKGQPLEALAFGDSIK